jgi:peptide/nickel transport system permease protein
MAIAHLTVNRRTDVINYILQRIVLGIPALLGATIIVFMLVRLQPGDVVIARLSESPRFTQADVSALRQRLGLDKPLLQQYGVWLGRLVRGDFGRSLWSDLPIAPRIVRALGISLELALLASFLAVLIGITTGAISALTQDTPLDYLARSISITALSVPSFWVATLLIVFPAIWWGYLPPLLYHPFTDDPGANLKQMAYPSLALALPLSAGIMRLTRSSVLEVLRDDYVRTAWAKGLQRRQVVLRHVLPNALIPVITLTGTQISALIGGTVIIETIFNLPGMGRLAYEATQLRDYTTLQAAVVVFAIASVITNLVVDVLYVVLDPRIRLT